MEDQFCYSLSISTLIAWIFLNSIYIWTFIWMLYLAATSMDIKYKEIMISSFIYVRTSMIIGQYRILIFMLGIPSIDKLQPGKNSLTWIQKEVVQLHLNSNQNHCIPWNLMLIQTFRQLQERQLVISEIDNVYASIYFLGRCQKFYPISILVIPILRWDLAKPMIKFLGVDSRQQHF